MCATFNGNLYKTIVPCYGFTNAIDKTKITKFYNKLYSLLRHIPKHNVLMIGGDINKTHISKAENYKLSSHNSPHRNGEYLLIF